MTTLTKGSLTNAFRAVASAGAKAVGIATYALGAFIGDAPSGAQAKQSMDTVANKIKNPQPKS